MLHGLTPSTKEAKAPLKGRTGFDDLMDKDVSESMHGLTGRRGSPCSTGDVARVWGVNSLAALPMFGGAFREDVAQQFGYRAPASSRQESGIHSGLRLAAVDPDAAVSAPGVASYEKMQQRAARPRMSVRIPTYWARCS